MVDELPIGQVSGVDPAERREDDERTAQGSALQHHPLLPVRPHQRPRVLHLRQKPCKYRAHPGTRGAGRGYPHPRERSPESWGDELHTRASGPEPRESDSFIHGQGPEPKTGELHPWTGAPDSLGRGGQLQPRAR